MDTNEFWQHIDSLRAGKPLPGSAASYNKRLRALLKTWDRDTLLAFDGHLRSQLARAMQRPIWLSAMLLNDGICDDETFRDYRCWLVALGESRFEAILDCPDHLTDIVPASYDGSDVRLPPLFWSTKRLIDQGLDLENLMAMAMKMMANQESLPVVANDDPPLGEKYWSVADEPEILSLMPRLRARFAQVRMRQHPLLAAYVRSAVVAGLGTVSVGDWLCSNGSTNGLRVVAIIDEDATASHFGGTRLTGDEGRYCARMQFEGGVTASYQLHGSHFHWPDQPDPGLGISDSNPEESAPDEAEWERRIEAIQARIAQALGKAPRVRYAAYDLDGDELPVDNLDDCAHPGRISFRWVDDTDGSVTNSEPLSNSTWLQLACLSDAMLEQLQDVDHVFLEGIDIVAWVDDNAVAEFIMGS